VGEYWVGGSSLFSMGVCHFYPSPWRIGGWVGEGRLNIVWVGGLVDEYLVGGSMFFLTGV